MQLPVSRFRVGRAVVAVALVAGAAGVLLASGAGRLEARPLRPADGFTAITSLGPFGLDPGGNPIPNGRVQSVARDPFDQTHERYLALADAGLWESTDGAQTWQRLPGLEQFGQWTFESGSIAFDPSMQGVVLIASPRDGQTTSQRGIYRSTDGGMNWSQPTGYQPPCGNGGNSEPTVVTFFQNTAYAAGDCAVGVSLDDGATWSWDAPSSLYLDGVAVDEAGTAFACAAGGIYRRPAGAHTSWTRVVSFLDPLWRLGLSWKCRIAASPDQPDHIFVAAKWEGECIGLKCYQSEIVEAYADNSSVWHTQNLMGGLFRNGRDVLATTTPVDGSPQPHFFLYWSSDANDRYQQCAPSSAFECSPGTAESANHGGSPWVDLGHGSPPGLHADSSQILFDTAPPYCIDVIADDSGIERPQQGNCRGGQAAWTLSNTGMVALEPYDLALGFAPGGGNDVYTADQDVGDSFLGSGATGWNVDLNVNADGVSIAVTGAGTQHVFSQLNVGPIYAGRGFLGPGGSPGGEPFESGYTGFSAHGVASFGDSGFLGVSHSADPGTRTGLFWSGDGGATWQLVTTFDDSTRPSRVLQPLILTERFAPTVVAAYVVATGRLWRILLSTTTRIGGVPAILGAEELPASSRNIGAFGAADSHQLIAFACEGESPCRQGDVITSENGGRRWATTAGWPTIAEFFRHDWYRNAYPLDDGGAAGGEIISVARDPVNPALLVVGTNDTGLFASSDSGASWTRFALVAPQLNTLRFDSAGVLYVASYGRGVFAIRPSVDRLRLHATIGHVDRQAVARFTATSRSESSAPQPGLSVDFSVENGKDEQVAGLTAVTDAKGIATAMTEPLPPGTYTVLATATNDKAATATAAAVTFVVPATKPYQ